MSVKKININIKDITDNIAENYFIKKSKVYSDKVKIAKEDQLKEVKKIKNHTLLTAALYGALGVLFLYIPQYLVPQYFAGTQYTISYINFNFELSIFQMLYGFVLVGIEIWLLMKGDLKAVGKISTVYGFKPKEENIETLELVYIGLGKDQRKFTEVGINPYQNFSKTGILFLRALFLIKALLSNFIFRIILKRVLGRLAIRAVIDLAGIPVYALWNAFASSIIVRKADMRMQAINQMGKTGNYFLNKYKENKTFRDLLYDTFEYIAITKRSFHPTDLIYAKYFLNIFGIKIKNEHRLSENYFEKVKNLPEDIKLAIGQLLILGFLLDGKIGGFEIRILKKLQLNYIIPYSIEEIKKWTKDYTLGIGFDKMFEKN